MRNFFSISCGATCVCVFGLFAAVRELVPNFNRMKSNAMVRLIDIPTLAQLDFAAYNANPVLFEPKMPSPKAPKKIPALEDLTFNGLISSVCNSLSETPLTEEEKECPLAWKPLNNMLWEKVKSDALVKIAAKINGEKWADPSIYQAYQEVTTAWLHQTSDSVQLWVKIEFAPWVKFLKNVVTDEDKDGFGEIYGMLLLDSLEPSVWESMVKIIREDYAKTVLTYDQIVDWANVLASYWYPTKNTDIVDMGAHTQWPNTDTEKKIKKTLKGITVQQPVAVIRGKPFGKPIYNVYVLSKTTATTVGSQTIDTASSTSGNNKKTLDIGIAKNFKANNDRFALEIKQFGPYQTWEKKNWPAWDVLKKMLSSIPAEQMGFKGKDNWLFFRLDIDYILGGDLSKQADNKNPFKHIVEFKKYLDSQNINFLFVPVPNKSEVYFENLPVDVTGGFHGYLNPYGRKFLKDLQDAGVEVIDLLPHFLEAKKQDKSFKEAVYQKQDTHWSSRGLQIAADLIAARITEYDWYKQQQKVKYTYKDTTFMRQGDIVQRLPESEQAAFPAVELHARQVREPDGSPYNLKTKATAPILLMGDSFTGVFEFVDCKSAGIGANIAAATQLPVDINTSWGGGPNARNKVLRAKKGKLDTCRLIIYMMVARDLYNYSQLWEGLKTD